MKERLDSDVVNGRVGRRLEETVGSVVDWKDPINAVVGRDVDWIRRRLEGDWKRHQLKGWIRTLLLEGTSIGRGLDLDVDWKDWKER